MTDDTYVPLHTGRTDDDDAQVIDDFFIETDAPAEPIVEPLPPSEPVPTKVPNRLITGAQSVLTTWNDPWLALPADINRESLTLLNHTAGATPDATFYIQYASDPGLVATGARLYTGDSVTLVGYTGPIYVRAVVGTCVFSWTAATK